MNRPSFKSFITPNLWSIIAIALVFTSTIAARSNAAPTLFPSATTTTISYQGTLSNAGGQPVNTATPMTFKLYTVPSGGTALWTEARAGANAVPIANGLFNVLLGSVTPINVSLLNQDLWLGISVNGDAEMSPREKLGSVPFAIHARFADSSPQAFSRVGVAEVSTTSNYLQQFVLVPDMQITFSLSEERLVTALFTGAFTNLTEIGDTVFFRIVVDGVPKDQISPRVFQAERGVPVVTQWAGTLPPGNHTIQIEWAVRAGTARFWSRQWPYSPYEQRVLTVTAFSQQ